MALPVEGQERGERRVEAEIAVEIERTIRAGGLAGCAEGDVGTGLVIIGIAVGNNHGEAVDRAALEDADEDFVAGGGAEIGGKGGLAEETGTPEGTRAHAHKGEGALFQKDPAVDVHHNFSFFKFSRPEPVEGSASVELRQILWKLILRQAQDDGFLL